MNIHYRPKVYTASKLKHAQMWIHMRTIWGNDMEFTARWPDLVGKVEDYGDLNNSRQFWLHDIQDVVRADCVLVLAEPEDRLRGALVEAGAGIATGKHVVLCGAHNHPDFGTWQFHPMVTQVESLIEARRAIIGSWRG